jgi:MEMO1 family protein
VAGQFYPNNSDQLYELIHRCFTNSLGPSKFPTVSNRTRSDKISEIECLIVPHAGYVYSGPIAAHSYNFAFDFLQKFKKESKIVVVILGPNHYGIGSGVSLSDSSRWQTPLGEVNVAADLEKRLVSRSAILDMDGLAHSQEHSIEVQLPFLQAVAGSLVNKISIIPISLMLQDLGTATQVASELLDLIQNEKCPFLILGSSDLTHYEPQKKASEKDHRLLAEVERVSLTSFYNVLERLNVSACGYGAIAAAIHISKMIGKQRGTVLKYATSGDTSGDQSSVVGYCSVHFEE